MCEKTSPAAAPGNRGTHPAVPAKQPVDSPTHSPSRKAPEFDPRSRTTARPPHAPGLLRKNAAIGPPAHSRHALAANTPDDQRSTAAAAAPRAITAAAHTN